MKGGDENGRTNTQVNENKSTLLVIQPCFLFCVGASPERNILPYHNVAT